MKRAALAGFLLCGLIALSRAADPVSEVVTVTDADGKTVKLAKPKFTTGVKRLSWLNSAKSADGPLAFEVREADSTNYAKGVVTLIPLSTLEAVTYDTGKQSVAVAVAGLKAPLSGTTQFKGMNTLGVEGDGGKFVGGVPKTGVKSIAFEGAKPLAERPKGINWLITIDQPKSNNPKLKVANLKALASLPGGREVLLDSLPTWHGPPIKFAPADVRFEPIEILGVDPVRGVTFGWVISNPAESKAHSPFVPFSVPIEKQKGTLLGLLGEVPGGWKFFPWHTVAKIERDRE